MSEANKKQAIKSYLFMEVMDKQLCVIVEKYSYTKHQLV